MNENKFDDPMAIFTEVGQRVFSRQAVFFLNAFWPEYKDQAETIYEYCQYFVELAPEKSRGCRLDEFSAHKFLENVGQTMTVLELRNKLREIDLDLDGQMSLIEYLINWSGQTVEELINRPQGTNEQMERAESALEAVNAEVERIEGEKSRLREEAQGSGVKARGAVAQLFELENADPIDLNRALVNAQAAVRKAKKLGGVDQVGLFWLERDLAELEKYKPKGGVRVSRFQK